MRISDWSSDVCSSDLRAYAAAAAEIFRPRAHRDQPNMLLAEAGTGIGKTLGYLAPASLWAGEAQGTVWISTYTKALQRQLDRDSLRLFPDPAAAATRGVEIGRASGRERGCRYGWMSGVAVYL